MGRGVTRLDPVRMFDRPMFPDIEVQLTGSPGNTGAAISLVADALRDAGLTGEEISAFRLEALSGTFEDALRTCMNWVTVR